MTPRKKATTVIKLKPREYVEVVWPFSASGPGWANRGVWLIVTAPSGTRRTECIQGVDLRGDATVLFSVALKAYEMFEAAVCRDHVGEEKE